MALRKLDFDRISARYRTVTEPARPFADEAKIRIIAAAESLYAVRSIESVSLREIAQSAGHANTNAVQYHFGNRDALVQAIFAWRVWQMEPARALLLEEADRSGLGDDLHALLGVLCIPMLDLVDAEGRHTYAAFMSKYLLQQRPAGILHAAENRPDISVNLRTTIARLSSLISADETMSDYRIALAYMMVTNVLVICDNEGVSRSNPVQLRQRFDTALAMAAVALERGRG
jgi:AcrR family transcriptional regulator